MTRLSELMLRERSPTLDQLVRIQESGNPVLSCDYYMDCKDLWELITGSKVLPQDKSQRLYVLGIREARLTGKIRLMVLVPTESMVSDALTKPMLSPGLLMLLTSGKVEIFNMPNHNVLSRIMPSLQEYDENDLVKDDDAILKDVEKMPQNVKASHATILLGMAGNLVASTTSMRSAMLLGAMATGAMAAGDVQKETNYMTEETYRVEYGGTMNYISVYIAIFLVVIFAIKIERYTWQWTAIIARVMQFNKVMEIAVKQEQPDLGPAPMDVDLANLSGSDGDEDLRQLRYECQQLKERVVEMQAYNAAMERSRDHYKKKADIAETNLAQRIGDEYDEARNLREERDRLLQAQQANRDRLHHVQGQLYTTRRHLREAKDEIENIKKMTDKDESETDESNSRKMPRTSPLSPPAAPVPTSVATASRSHEDSNKMDAIQNTINEMNQMVDAKNEEIRDLQETVKSLTNQVRDLKASDDANDTSAREYKAMYERNVQMVQQHNATFHGLEREVERLQGELRQANDRLQSETNKEKVPERVFLTRSGECFHKDGCNHLMHGRNPRPQQSFSRCRDCWRG